MKQIIIIFLLTSSNLLFAQFSYDKPISYNVDSSCYAKVNEDVKHLAIKSENNLYSFYVAICVDDLKKSEHTGWRYGCSNFIKRKKKRGFEFLENRDQITNARYVLNNNYKRTYHILNDSTGIEYFDIVTLEIDNEGKHLIQTIETDIICPEKVDERLIQKLESALINRGYLTQDKLSMETILDGLYKYQKDMKLPLGYLDVKTLTTLEINY